VIHRVSLLGDKEATFSDDERHRFYLGRRVELETWQRGGRLLFIGLNPSIATHEIEDPTIRKETKFARAWGYDQLDKGNIFSLRSTDPKGLLSADDADGDPENMREIVARTRAADLVVAAWGGPYAPKPLARMVAARASEVVERLKAEGVYLHCLATTKDGFPRHPLYLPDASVATPWGWS
jgi:hypothetical protein